MKNEPKTMQSPGDDADDDDNLGRLSIFLPVFFLRMYAFSIIIIVITVALHFIVQ